MHLQCGGGAEVEATFKIGLHLPITNNNVTSSNTLFLPKSFMWWTSLTWIWWLTLHSIGVVCSVMCVHLWDGNVSICTANIVLYYTIITYSPTEYHEWIILPGTQGVGVWYFPMEHSTVVCLLNVLFKSVMYLTIWQDQSHHWWLLLRCSEEYACVSLVGTHPHWSKSSWSACNKYNSQYHVCY